MCTKLFCLGVCSLLFSFSAYSFSPEDIVVNLIESTNGFFKSDPCAPGSQPDFKSKDEFIQVACGEGDLDKILGTIRAKNGADALSLYSYGRFNLETFSSSLKFFRRSEKVTLPNSLTPDSLPKAKKTGAPVRCWVTAKNPQLAGQELQFGNLHVVGDPQESVGESVEDQKRQSQRLIDKFSEISPDCYLAEGVDMEKGLSCKQALEIAITPEYEIKSRRDLVIWWAFYMGKKIHGSGNAESSGKPSVAAAYAISKGCKNPLMVMDYDRIKELGPALIDAVGPLKNINFRNTCPKGQKY